MKIIYLSILRALCAITVGALLIIYGLDTIQYILCIGVILLGVLQLVSLGGAHRDDSVGFGYWIMPILLVLAGMIALLRPELLEGNKLTYIGCCMIYYGITEFVCGQKCHDSRKQAERRITEGQKNAADEALAQAQQAQDDAQAEAMQAQDEAMLEQDEK